MKKLSRIPAFALLFAAFLFVNIFAQEIPAKPRFIIGEKLTYSVSFNKQANAGYFETYVVSAGKLEGMKAAEIRASFRTTGLVSIAYPVDEDRQVFASIDTGLPLYIKKSSNFDISGKDKSFNFILNPTPNADLISALFQIRYMNGNAVLTLQEGDKIHPLTSQSLSGARLKTDIGEFETIIATIQSEYFTEIGISNLQVTFSGDEKRLPLVIRFNTAKGEFRANIASEQFIAPEPDESQPQPTPTITPTPTPRPIQTPKPTPTPDAYKENRPLSDDLPFKLGEKLTFNVTANKQQIGKVILQAKERKQINGKDSLMLTASIVEAAKLLNMSDLFTSTVDPESLAPYKTEIKFAGVFSRFNQQILFDQARGMANQKEIPIGTHDLLSFAYAVRSINLKPSKNTSNPVNDTRVAVYLGDNAIVFTVRPLNTEILEYQGRKISTQLVSFSTGNPQIDQYNPRLWIANDKNRLPIRFTLSFGGIIYQADLIDKK